jgi:hypothetical protein
MATHDVNSWIYLMPRGSTVNLFVRVGNNINVEGRPAKAVKETTDGTDMWTITCDDGGGAR